MGMGRCCSHTDWSLCAHLGGRENIRFMEALKVHGRDGHGTRQYQREIVP